MAAVYASFSDNIKGAAAAIRLCAVLLLVIGVLCWLVIENTNAKEQTESLKDVCVGMVKCMKIPRVWLLAGIVFTAYSIYGLMSYINTYLVTLYGMSETAAANLGGIRTSCREWAVSSAASWRTRSAPGCFGYIW